MDNSMIVGKSKNIAKNIGPMISYKHEFLDDVFKKFFLVKRKTNVILGKIFKEFGYSDNDNILLTDIIYENNNIVISYMVNGVDSLKKIVIKYSDMIYKYRLILSDDNSDISCMINVYNKNNILFNVSLIKERLGNGNVYMREYDSRYAKYRVIVNGKEVELFLEINRNYELNDNDMLFLKDENKLENYFKNIDVNVGIENIYSDIIKYIGNIIKYLDIKLSIISCNNREITDMISIKNDKCYEFMVTSDNRCITMNKDGNYVCKYKDGNVEFVTSVNEDGVNYSIGASNIVLLGEKLFVYGVDKYVNSVNEIDECKKRIKKLIPDKK